MYIGNSPEPTGSVPEAAPVATPTAAPTVAAVTPTATAAPARPTPMAVRPAVILVLPTDPPAPPVAAPERLLIAAIGLDAAVLPLGWVAERNGAGEVVSAWEPLPPGAAGWHTNSAAPGQGSNTVISGHHNTDGEVFRHLVDVSVGAEVVLQAGGELHTYRVVEKLILPERYVTAEQRLQNATWMQLTNEERLTLITCWPYETNTHRLIVVARPDGDPAKLAQRESDERN